MATQSAGIPDVLRTKDMGPRCIGGLIFRIRPRYFLRLFRCASTFAASLRTAATAFRSSSSLTPNFFAQSRTRVAD
jgi:hypothetical protein